MKDRMMIHSCKLDNFLQSQAKTVISASQLWLAELQTLDEQSDNLPEDDMKDKGKYVFVLFSRYFAHCFGPRLLKSKQDRPPKKRSTLISKQLELYTRISFCRNIRLGIALSISRFSFEFSFVWGRIMTASRETNLNPSRHSGFLM